MLSELFPRTHRRYEESPVAAELEQVAAWFLEVGYSRDNTRDHLFRLRTVLERIGGLPLNAVFTEARLQEAFTSDRWQALYRGTQRAFARFLCTRDRLLLSQATIRFSTLRANYHDYLTDLRGFTTSTIRQHQGTIEDFLSRGVPSLTRLAQLTHADIEKYVELKSREVSRQSMQHIVARLRAFLRYCRDQGETTGPLDCIDTPRTYRGELPPRALEWKIVLQLLASVDRKSRAGWRDYTMLHLMAYYGLRPSEIATLRLDSINWTTKTISVEQRKTRSTLVLPLAQRTLSVLRRYLRVGRPQTVLPQLFVRARRPTGPIQHYAVGEVFAKRARLSGLPLSASSSYALRHAFAMRLLRRGVGVKAIGDLLGHHSLESTCVYLRLDLEMLREVALPVPQPARH